jgi:hypothetical protein
MQDKDTIDELGIGVVRDTLSDLMFPGTSVLQTRAKGAVALTYLPWSVRVSG